MEIKYLPDLSENLDSYRKPITAKDRIEGEIPYYGASGIVDYVKDYIFDEELLLVSEDGANLVMRSTPIAFSISGKTWVNNHAHVLRFKDRKLQAFVEYYLNSIDLSPYISGTAQPKLNQQMLNTIPIPVPSDGMIENTVAVLDRIVSIRKQREKELEELDYLIKARFVELFGRPEDKKYPSVRLGDYARLQGGYAFKSKDFVDEGVPLVQIGNVNKDYLDWDVINAVPEEYIDKYSEFALSKDDLVMAMTRPIIRSLDSVKIAKVAEDDLPCLLNQRVGRFQINDKIHPVFLEILCKTDDFKDYVERVSGNSLQPNISSKQVEDYIIILPPIELQEKFAEFVKQVDKSKVAVQKSLYETQLLLDSLMQEYFG